jgi:hypothetical protein
LEVGAWKGEEGSSESKSQKASKKRKTLRGRSSLNKESEREAHLRAGGLEGFRVSTE